MQNDTKEPLIERIYRLRREFGRQSARFGYNSREQALWLIKAGAIDELARNLDFVSCIQIMPDGSKFLFGTPIRETVDDPPGTPDVALIIVPNL